MVGNINFMPQLAIVVPERGSSDCHLVLMTPDDVELVLAGDGARV